MLSKLYKLDNKINKKLDAIDNRLTLVLLISIATCLIKVTAFYSSYSFGEVWFEEGYLYYGSVINHGFFKNLIIDDASYLNTLPKIVSIILIKIFGVTSYFPYLFKIINIYIFSLFISLLLLKEFDEYFGSKFLRIIAVILITLFPHYDMSNPVNSSYACIVPIMWFLIKFNSKDDIKYKLYPLYIISIPIAFICKPLISISTIPVILILISKKLYNKDYKNIFFLLFVISCSVFHFIYIKYMNDLHVYPINDDYFDISFSVENILKIINFVISSIGISLMGYMYLVVDENSLLYITLSYIIGLTIIVYSSLFLIKLYNIKKLGSTSNAIFLLLWISLFLHACAAIWNHIYPVYSQESLYKISKHFLNRQWWTIFSTSLMIYLFLINNCKTKLYNIFDQKIFHKIFLIIILILSTVFFERKIDGWSKHSYRNAPKDDLLSSDWKNYTSSNIGNDCILTNHFPYYSIYCTVLDSQEHHYVSNKKYFDDYILSKKERNYNFLIARINATDKSCKDLKIVINNKESIQPEFTPNSRFYIFKLDKDRIANKPINIESSCAKGAWIWLARRDK